MIVQTVTSPAAGQHGELPRCNGPPLTVTTVGAGSSATRDSTWTVHRGRTNRHVRLPGAGGSDQNRRAGHCAGSVSRGMPARPPTGSPPGGNGLRHARKPDSPGSPKPSPPPVAACRAERRPRPAPAWPTAAGRPGSLPNLAERPRRTGDTRFAGAAEAAFDASRAACAGSVRPPRPNEDRRYPVVRVRSRIGRSWYRTANRPPRAAARRRTRPQPRNSPRGGLSRYPRLRPR